MSGVVGPARRARSWLAFILRGRSALVITGRHDINVAPAIPGSRFASLLEAFLSGK